MPWYIRIGFRPERWFPPPWLPAGEVPADAIKDFSSVKGNGLSVFVVTNEEEGIRAAVAIAARRYQDRALGYALFDVDATAALGILTEPSAGETPDPVVNTWHRDLKNLTFSKLAEIAKLIRAADRVEDLPIPAFRARLTAGIESGRLDRRLVERKNLG